MVATKSSNTRVKCREEGSNTEQATMEDTSLAPVHTRRTLRRDAQAEENNDDKDNDDSEIPKLRSHIVTRSRNLSGQSNADVSETESTASNSSTRITRSRKTIGHITDTPMKLRNRPSTVMTEPIIESQEGEISEAESNCSSLSARARRRPTRIVTHSVRKRSQKSGLGSEPLSDHSEAESNCSSVPGVQYNVSRSTRKTEIKCPSTREDQSIEISDNESFSSDYCLKPPAERSCKKSTGKLASEEVDCVGNSNLESSQEQETFKNPECSSYVPPSIELSSVAEQSILSSPRRSMRNRAVSQREVLISVHKSQTRASSSKVSSAEQLENNELPVVKDDVGLPVEVNAASITELSVSQSTEKENFPDQINDLQEDPTDEEESKKQVHCENDDYSQAIKGTSKDRELVEVEEVHELAEGEGPGAMEEKQGSGLVDSEMEEVCNEPAVEENKGIEEAEDREIEECSESVGEETKNMEEECNESAEKEVIELEEDSEVEEEVREVVMVEEDSEVEEEVREVVMVEEDSEVEEEVRQVVMVEEDNEVEEEVREVMVEEDSEEEDIEAEEDSEEETIEVVDEVTTKQLGKLEKSSTQPLQDLAEDGLFVIDKAPGLDLSKKYYVEPEENDIEEEDEESENEEPSKPTDDEDEVEELFSRPKSGLTLSSTIDTGLDIKKLGGLYISFDAEKPKPGPSFFKKMKKENKKTDELLKKSVLIPGFEKKEAIPPYTESQRQLKKKHKAEREKSTGQGWFDMKAPEMTEELKNDLKALKMRSAMDPKHFYKKSDRDGFPKYFQVGTVVDNPVDFYHSRIPKKQRKRTIVDELLADADFRRYNKKKYQEIMVEKAARAEGKKKRRKKKFRT